MLDLSVDRLLPDNDGCSSKSIWSNVGQAWVAVVRRLRLPRLLRAPTASLLPAELGVCLNILTLHSALMMLR